MRALWKRTGVVAGLVVLAGQGFGADLRVRLSGTGTFDRKMVRFRCDDQASKLGLPSGLFQVEYINGAGNSLAILPIEGNSLIFANVLSGSGARYAASRYVWSDGGGRGSSLQAEGVGQNGQGEHTLCHEVK